MCGQFIRQLGSSLKPTLNFTQVRNATNKKMRLATENVHSSYLHHENEQDKMQARKLYLNTILSS